MKECDVCGTPNLKANNYCTHCGNRIAMDNICPFCGELNSDDSSYCSNCNKQIRPVSIDSFEKLFTDYNKLLLAKAEISDEDYSKLKAEITFDGTPTTVFYEDGKLTSFYDRMTSAVSSGEVISKFKEKNYIK